MKTFRIAAVIAVASTAVLWGADLAGAGEEPASITLGIDPDSGPVGTVISAGGLCFETGGGDCDSVILTLIDPNEAEVDTVTVDAIPAYEGTLTVPADGPCGTYVVLAEGEENEVIEVETSLPFEVPCPDTTTVPEESSTTSESVAATGATRPTFTG